MPLDVSDDEKTPFQIFDEISNELNADIIYINAGIERGVDATIINALRSQKKKDNVILLLVTGGGSADVAFKITRALQNNYKNYSIFVPGWCKSAGTLIAIGAHTIYLADHGELGPLDIQMGKRDELNDFISGLDLDYGIRSLRETAFSMFEHFMLRIITKSGYRVTLKTAAEIASGLTQAYIGKIAEQISPLNVGETVRLMTIATEYGSRLNARYENLRDDSSLGKLVSGYSSHSFVIDLEEARDIFRRVRPAPAALRRLMDTMGWEHAFPLQDAGQEPIVGYLRGSLDDDGTDDEQDLEIGDADVANIYESSEVAKKPGQSKPSPSNGRANSEADLVKGHAEQPEDNQQNRQT